MWTNEEQIALEVMIDKHGLSQVLSEIAGICNQKAPHISASYSDDVLASQWDRATSEIQDCAEHTAILTVSPRSEG